MNYRVLADNNTTPLVDRTDLFNKCANFTRAQESRDAGIYPYFHAVEVVEEPEVLVDGKQMIMMSSNNYLGLTEHPKVREAASNAVLRYGTGCSGSRFLNGTFPLHEQLEAKLAEFLQREEAIVFPTGFQANLGAISALVGKNDIVAIDRMNHASIFDGCRLSYGRIRKYRHNDMSDLDRILNDGPSNAALVVADGVFSMEGDILDLPNMVEVCQRHGARILVDDAHGVGVLGANGRGTGEHFGLDDQIDLVMGTFSKSLATIGGYLAADHYVIDFLKHHARPLIFSASLPPASVAAALAAIEVIEQEPERREILWRNAKMLREGFQQIGFDTGPSETPVVPVMIGDENNILLVWRRLFDAGVFASPVLYPAVPPGRALMRTSCMATHTPAHLDRVLSTFEKVAKEMNLLD